MDGRKKTFTIGARYRATPSASDSAEKPLIRKPEPVTVIDRRDGRRPAALLQFQDGREIWAGILGRYKGECIVVSGLSAIYTNTDLIDD